MLLDSSYLASLPQFPHLTKKHLRGLSAVFPTSKVNVFVQAAARAQISRVTMVAIAEATHLVKL